MKEVKKQEFGILVKLQLPSFSLLQFLPPRMQHPFVTKDQLLKLKPPTNSCDLFAIYEHKLQK